MNTYISKEKLNKKLCIHCKHVESRNDKYFCDLISNDVDGAPLYECSQVRNQRDFCNGEKWIKQDDIIGCDTQQEVNEKTEEEGINSWMDSATRMVLTNFYPMYPCGYLEKAILRVKNKFDTTHSVTYNKTT